MFFLSKVSALLDERNLKFTNAAKAELADLSTFSTESLSWLMIEHYQFSFRNTVFLARAAEVADTFANADVARELRRNLAEENGHAAMYRAALRRIDIDVNGRTPFPPTDYFLYRIARIIEGGPSLMLGAMYATETAAIFEHEVYLAISQEVVARGSYGVESRPLIAFHEMHLGGVEQSHKDELGIFLHDLDAQHLEPNGDGVSGALAVRGGRAAINTMGRWWQELLTQIAAPARDLPNVAAIDHLEPA